MEAKLGDIFQAFSYLNKSLKLGLTKQQLYRAERSIKFDHSIVEKFHADISRDQDKLMEQWEFKTVLVPRKKPLTDKQRAEIKREAS